ncbi:MAG: hypothetical protein QG623_700 [Patescibacteria group bacterium]|nr:hypothetical protein [Patescibacteria group bacterium]
MFMKKIKNIIRGVIVGSLVFLGIMSFAGFFGVGAYALEDCSAFVGPAKAECDARNAAAGGGGGGGAAVDSACEGVSSLGVTCGGGGTAQDVINGPIGTFVSLISYVVGVACVVMIIYGAFRFITSGGNSDATKSARNTILYALVGLFIVLTVNILVNFVFNQANDINNPTPAPTAPVTTPPAI